MKKNTLILVLLALSFTLLAQPTAITWQGKLLDASGNAITQNNVALTFAMFDASTGGNQLWPASGVVNKTVDVTQGLYSVQLGTGTGDDIAFTASMFDGKTPWLEVTVGTETLPRTEITNVPFALISNQLSATGWQNPGEIGKTTPNTGKFTSLETGSFKVTTGAAAGKVLTSDADGNASWQTTTLANFEESAYTFDSNTGVKLMAKKDGIDNLDFVLQPKGAGAILVRQPDGTNIGGENRGLLAVDLQMYRSQPSQVASGMLSSTLGGMENTVSGMVSSAVGGGSNIVNGDYSSIVGGNSNTISIDGGMSAILGGVSNSVSNLYSSVLGGTNNSAAGYNSTIAGGAYNTANNTNSSLFGSYLAIADADYSTILGGMFPQTKGSFSSVLGGIYSTSYSYGEIVTGLFSTEYTPNSSSWIHPEDRLFVVGNGTGFSTRSNALTILKNANTTIGGSLTINGNGTDASITLPADRGASGQVLTTDGAGGTGWTTPASGAVTDVTGIAPIVSSGGTTPAISISEATTSAAGSMSVADKNKLDAMTGTANGQMLYWNGTTWVMVAPGKNGQIFKYINGVPTWVDENINKLAIGDYYQGGIIAYFLQPGDPDYDANVRHGLIAAPMDQSSNAMWGCWDTSISGADGTALGTGAQNTLDILAGCSEDGIAAWICNVLELNGYDDWFLPSKDELHKLYLSKDLIGGFSAESFYWSSSEYSSRLAWIRHFNDGYEYYYQKFLPDGRVRAVRAF